MRKSPRLHKLGGGRFIYSDSKEAAGVRGGSGQATGIKLTFSRNRQNNKEIEKEERGDSGRG